MKNAFFASVMILSVFISGCAGKAIPQNQNKKHTQYITYAIFSDDKNISFEATCDLNTDYGGGVTANASRAIITSLDKYLHQKSSRFLTPDEIESSFSKQRPRSSIPRTIFVVGYDHEKKVIRCAPLDTQLILSSDVSVFSNEAQKKRNEYFEKIKYPHGGIPNPIDCTDLTSNACEKTIADTVMETISPFVDRILEIEGY